MPSTFGSRITETNGNTAVTAIFAPGVGVVRKGSTIRVNNRETASTINVIIRIKSGIEIRVVASDVALAVAGTLTATDVTLSTEDESLEVILSASPTIEADITSSFEDVTPL